MKVSYLRWIVVGLLLLLPSWAWGAETIQDRCTTDSECTMLMYEPFNVQDKVTCNQTQVDPSDSPENFTIGPVNGTGFCWEPNNVVGGPSTVLPGPRSFLLKGLGGFFMPANHDWNLTGKKRVCMVHYQFTEGNWTTGTCPTSKRHKIQRFEFGGKQHQTTAGNCGNPVCCYGNITTNGEIGQTIGLNSQRNNSSDANPTWVRYEFCAGTTASDLEATTNISVEHRAITLDDGTIYRSNYDLLADPAGGGGFVHAEFDWWGSSNPRYLSTAAVMSYDTDNDQWPGPDCDIEPGAAECAGGPTWNAALSFPTAGEDNTCVNGAADCSNIDIRVTGSGTEPSGDVTHEVDCENLGASVDATATNANLAHTFANVCSFSGVGTKTVWVRSTRNGNADTATASFTVVAAPTWSVAASLPGTDQCTVGSAACDDITVRLTGSGSASQSSVLHELDCLNLGASYEFNATTASGTHDFTGTEGCDFSGETTGTYSISVKSTAESVEATDQVTFMVNPQGVWEVETTIIGDPDCFQGEADCDNINVLATGTGTANFAAGVRYWLDCDIGDGIDYLDGDSGTITLDSHTFVGGCSYSSDPAGTYVISVRSTADGVTDDSPDCLNCEKSFTVFSPANIPTMRGVTSLQGGSVQ